MQVRFLVSGGDGAGHTVYAIGYLLRGTSGNTTREVGRSKVYLMCLMYLVVERLGTKTFRIVALDIHFSDHILSMLSTTRDTPNISACNEHPLIPRTVGDPG